MKIVALNKKIKIQNKKLETDKIGNHKSIWSDYITTNAYISFQGKGEAVFLGMEQDSSDISFTIRYQQKLKSINSSEYRISFDENIYNILSVDFMNYKNKLIKLRCKKVSRWMWR